LSVTAVVVREMSVVADRISPVDRNCIRFGWMQQTSVRVCRKILAGIAVKGLNICSIEGMFGTQVRI